MNYAIVLALALAAATTAGARAQPNVDELLVRVGERVSEFYTRAKNVVCIETSTVQGIDLNYSVVGFSRSVESELRIEADNEHPGGEATVVRTVRKINGRVPRERDKKDRTGCTDPSPVSAEPLAFLLPAQRSAYQFRIAGTTSERNRSALLLEYASVNRRSNSELIEAPNGVDDCFDWVGHIASRGRVWIDASSYDVLRVERGLVGPVDVKVSALIQRRHHLPNWVTLLRDDLILRYKTVAFSDPAEVLLLPESIITVNLVRGGLQSTRRSQTFSDYRRFVADGKVLP
ncbi:MAG TPA: hypothetical protein VM115_12630 [Vicinamibacterales bacterium]|nr:hypothetical protein [Vicinamibacterales bacterium]